jgi:hypothetical protein
MAMTTVSETHIIEQIQTSAKPKSELKNALAQISSNGKPSVEHQGSRFQNCSIV